MGTTWSEVSERSRGQGVKVGSPYLVCVDAVVDGPGCLEVLQHALLERLRQAVHTDEVLQVLHARVVQRAPRVHALDDGRHVAEDHGVHERCAREGTGETREHESQKRRRGTVILGCFLTLEHTASYASRDKNGHR